MNSIIVILVCSLLSWAWLLKTWAVAGLIIAIILTAKSTAWRWQITSQQFYRWGDLSSLLTVMLLLYFYFIQVTDRPIFIGLKWLPLLFAPVLFAQLFSTEQKLPLGTLFYSFRKIQPGTAKTLDFQLPYAILTLLSGGAANVQNMSYFIVASVFMLAVLWSVRPKHTQKWLWLLLVLVMISLSHLGQFGLRRLQTILEYKSIEWLSGLNVDPFKSQTSIGDVGEMKLSDKILFRVKADMPMYLLQATYNRYTGKSWTVSDYGFSGDNPVKAQPKQLLQHLEILQQFNQREEILALPDGTVEITGISGSDFQYNSLGAVKIVDTPDFGDYTVIYTGKRTNTPNRHDLQTPKQHKDWIARLGKQLKLSELKPAVAAQTIQSYFQRNFHYSLYLGSEPDPDLALRSFILKRKAGHCEYFAAASVLLLRQAGIPARLANGYVVEEFDPQQNLYLVRSRHAHAWAIAYFNGFWQIVDSTPSQWLQMEDEKASIFQPITDWFSKQLFLFKQWRLQQDNEVQNPLWLAAAELLAVYIFWRIYSARRQLTRESKVLNIASEAITCQGVDSEFYLIAEQFQDTEYAKNSNESMQEWVKRLQTPELIALYKLHYQLRFDPCGLPPENRELLKQQVSHWLKNNN